LLNHVDSMPLTAAEEEKIVDMAKNDPDNTVRAGAIDLLNRVGRDKYAALFLKLAQDSSYYVAGAALNAYLENENNPQKEALVEGFLENSNVQVVVPLAENFIRIKDTNRTEWFQKKIK